MIGRSNDSDSVQTDKSSQQISEYELGCFPPRKKKSHTKFPKSFSVIHETLTLSLSVFLSGPSVHACADSYGPSSSLSCREISQETFISSCGVLIKGQQVGSFCVSVCLFLHSLVITLDK